MKTSLGKLALPLAAAGAVLLAAAVPARTRPAGTVAGKEGPNVLLITVDTLRPDRLGCYGNGRVATPAIDGLARRGALFTRAFAHNPETLPSHANILLGTTALAHGVHDNQHFVVPDGALTLAGHLKGLGYATGAFVGAFPLDSRFGLTRGFDVYDDHYGTSGSQEFSYVERKAEAVVKPAREWLREQKGPWFLWVHCFDPHQRYDPPEPFRTEYKDRLYDGEVAYVDHALAPLLDDLRARGLEDRTVIVFTGDHGESLGQHGESTHGYFAYNSTLWVPLILAVPGLKPARIEERAGHIDIFPTVCEALKIEAPAHLQGLSLLPAAKGRKLPARAIYFESMDPYYGRGWAPLKGIIAGDMKYIDSPIPELYDLRQDFDETKDLAGTSPLDGYRRALAGTMEKQASAGTGAAPRAADRQTMDKLKSLGYLASPHVKPKDVYTAQDDLKVLLPYQSQLQQAMGAYHRGDLERSAALLKAIIAGRRDFDLAYSYLATILKEQKKYKEAIAVLREGYQNCPGNYKVITTFGIVLTEVGAYDEAVRILREGLAIIDHDPELWNYLGVAYWKKNDFGEATTAFERSLALDRDYPIALNNLGSLYLSIYLQSRKAADLERAVGNFDRAIALDPRYDSAYNGKGLALKMAGDLDGAIASWEKAVEIKPDFGFALYNLGLAHLLKGNKAEALVFLQRYKDRFYGGLPPSERQKLDEYIAKCR